MRERKRRKKRIYGSSERPRLVVFRSLKNIYGQIVDDYSQKSILGASSLSEQIRDEVQKKSKSKQDISKLVGKLIAQKAKDHKIKRVIFDRNGYAYHGRVKSLAEGAREGGLEF
jgi:large subunit ribosomal protein L18